MHESRGLGDVYKRQMETINNTFLDYGIDFHDIICAKQDEKTEVIEI